MAPRKLLVLTSAILFLFSFAVAQTQLSESDADKAKKKKEVDERVVQMLDQLIGEASTLRLSQNRAIVYAMAGDLFWQFDKKRSRELFRNAAAEILTFNLENEKEKRENTDAFAGLMDFGQDARGEILPLVAKNDAELALELLIQTRPAKLTEAMLKAAQPNAKASGDMMSFNLEKIRIGQELALEQQFALLAADENPEKAIKLLKESLAKGVSYNVIPLLQKVNGKDEKKAAELGGDVIKKLVDLDLAKSDEDMRVALHFLQYAFKPTPAANAKDKPFAFSDSQIKDLAGKVAVSLIQPSKSMSMAMFLNQAMPMLERFVPDKAAILKQRQAENETNMPPEFKGQQQLQKMFDANSTPEDILAQLPKLQGEFEKTFANQALLSKIGQIDDDARAKKLIDQIPDEKTRASALEQFEADRIDRTAIAGQLDDARKLIGNLTKKKTQIQRLVSLAIDFQKKGGEKDIANAKSLMKDAKALTNEYGETNDDIADIMEVVRGYVTVDPDTAFRMFEPVIGLINDHVQATSVLARFNPQYATFKKGELTMKVNVSGNPNDSPLFRFIAQMQLLGKADLERMYGLADKFGRNDSRTIVKLYVLQGFLKEDKKPSTPPMPSGIKIVF
jgi:hypothetical protein